MPRLSEEDLGFGIQNTQSLRLDPQLAEEFHLMEPCRTGGLQLLPVMSGETFGKLVAYPVIVEMWQRKKSGRHQRAWLRDFTETERNTLSRYYGRFYRWHLISGTPHHVACQLRTLELLQRAVNWFASLD